MPGRVRMLGDADTLGLNCLFAGDRLSNVFHVKVGKRCTVAELRAIVCRDGGVRARFPDISSEGVQLWKVYDVPQILLLPQNLRNQGGPVEGSESLHLADIFRDAPADDCLHVLVQRVQINVRSKPQDAADSFRHQSPSSHHHPGWPDAPFAIPIDRPSVLSLSNGPWSGPPALRSAPVGFTQQRSPNASPGLVSHGTPVNGQALRPSLNEWNAESAVAIPHSFGLFPRSQGAVHPSWNQSPNAIRSTSSSPGRPGASIHQQEHLERAIFELVDEDPHDHQTNHALTSPAHSPSPVTHTKHFNRGTIAYSSPPITPNYQIPFTSSPQSLPISSSNNTPPISPLRSTPSGGASPVSEKVMSSPFLSLWSLPSDITSPNFLIAYLRRLKSIARFHLINLFRTRPTGHQVFWLEFASASEATQVRDFLVVKKTSTGELVDCPYVSEEEYLEALSVAGDTDKWPNPHGLTNLPARAPQPTTPRLSPGMNKTPGPPVAPPLHSQRFPAQPATPQPSLGMNHPLQGFQMTISDSLHHSAPFGSRQRNFDPVYDNLPPLLQKPVPSLSSPEKGLVAHSDDRTYSPVSGLSMRTARRATSPSPTSMMSNRLETLPEDPEASESETDEALEPQEPIDLPTHRGRPLDGAMTLPSIASSQGSGSEIDDHFGPESNLRTPTRSHYAAGRKIQRSSTMSSISPTSTPSTSASSDDFVRHVGGRH